MTGSERAALAGRLRSSRWRLLLALRDVAAVAALCTYCAIAYGAAVVTAVMAAVGGARDVGTASRLAIAVLLALALILTFRTAWSRMTGVRRAAGELKRDLRAGLVEETVHRIVAVRLLGTRQAGWFCAFLEDDRGRTIFLQSMPAGHAGEGLAETFPPASVRFEHALHSGHRFAENREGPFGGDCATLEFEDVPGCLPAHGTLFETPLAEVEARLLGIGRR